jgi:hypothetical protein
MIPGLTNWNPEIKSGDVTAITLQNGVPIAVGVAALDIGRLSKAAGEKGKAVYLVHCYHDDLWALGSKAQPPESISPRENTELKDAVQQLSLETTVEDSDGLRTEDVPTIPSKPHEEPVLKPDEEISEPSISGSLYSRSKLI